MSLQTASLAFIGAGNMARSLIGGLIADGLAPARLWATDVRPEALAALSHQFSINTTTTNTTAVNAADVIVLAVKPQHLRAVALEIAATVQARRPLIVSIVAGVRTHTLAQWLGAELAMVRTMPNLPALVQSAATGMYATAGVTAAQRNLAESILRAVGLTVWLDQEEQLDAVTALSGSGPAYFFLVMEAMEAAGVAMGLPAETARLLTLQTAFGAAKLALESRIDAATLRQQVTSPGGTTERALQTLHAGELEALFARAIGDARTRACELADQFGAQA